MSASSENKIGFFLNEKGFIHPTNEYAEKWLTMSVFDEVKKKNLETYQSCIKLLA